MILSRPTRFDPSTVAPVLVGTVAPVLVGVDAIFDVEIVWVASKLPLGEWKEVEMAWMRELFHYINNKQSNTPQK